MNVPLILDHWFENLRLADSALVLHPTTVVNVFSFQFVLDSGFYGKVDFSLQPSVVPA